MSILPSGGAYNMYAAAILTLLLFGLFVHALVFYSLVQHRDNRERVLTPFILSIAIANTAMILFSFPITFANAVAHRWLFSHTFCRVEGFVGGIATISTIYTLICVVFKIHCIVLQVVARKPTRFRQTTSQSPVGVLALVWFLSIVVMLPPVTGLTTMTYEAGQTNCAPNWRSNNQADRAYTLILVFVAFVLPSSACFYFLTKIRRELSLLCFHPRQPQARMAHGYQSITKVVAVSVFVYVVAWLPYCICVLVAVFGGAAYLTSEGATFIPTLIAKLSILGIPVIYFVLNTGFRRTVTQLLSFHRPRITRVKPAPRNHVKSRRHQGQQPQAPGRDVTQNQTEFSQLSFASGQSYWTYEDDLEFSAVTNSTASHKLEIRRNAVHVHVDRC